MNNLIQKLFLFLILPLTIQAGEIETFHLDRPNGSLMTGYLVQPEGRESYPLLLMIEGSQNESVVPFFADFIPRAEELGAGIIAIEKQGIYGPEYTDLNEYHKYNCRSHRIDDHLFLIDQLKNGLVPNWNGQLIVIGGSEGGAIGISVTARTPEVCAAIIVSTGGGMSTKDELRLAITRYMESTGASQISTYLMLQTIDWQCKEMIHNPTHKKYFYDYTYKWWASHLTYPHLLTQALTIECPIYYAHGTADEFIPVESADLLVETFGIHGKKNLTYGRLEGFPHDVCSHGFDEVFIPAFKWLRQIVEWKAFAH